MQLRVAQHRVKGSRWEQAVVYEMHTGTFTLEGTLPRRNSEAALSR
ncbi:hypothetical protein KCP76_22250 [Salmonella enterica subsp. enterica serovar Weltevreden]|nr:hypothetical protein KCP76_22250 [Salmonella enterica subsp. enterica serovar Weltevreden]